MTSPSTVLDLAYPRTAPSSEWLEEQDAVTLRGNLAVVSVLDVVQWLCTNGQSWILRLYRQEVEASVTVTAGQLVDARWGTLTGEAALIEILGCGQGFFQLEPIEGEIVATLQGDWRATLILAVQALDERRPGSQDSCRHATAVSADRLKPPRRSGEHRVAAIPREATIDAAQGARASVPRHPEGDAAPESSDQASMAELSASTHGVRVDGPRLPARRNQAATYLTDLGFAALRNGNLVEARHHWTRALLCDPDNRTLRLNLRKLDEKTTVSR